MSCCCTFKSVNICKWIAAKTCLILMNDSFMLGFQGLKCENDMCKPHCRKKVMEGDKGCQGLCVTCLSIYTYKT